MGTPIDIGSTVTTPIKALYRNSLIGLGTGFFYKFGTQTFLITNWHVVAGRHFETLRPLHSMCALPDRLKFLVGCRGDIGEWMEVDCALYEDSSSNDQPEKPIWLEHAIHGRKIDVVAIPIDLPENGEVHTIDRVNTVPKMLLTVSKDVFILGYPKGINGGRGFPIWKRASLATEPAIQHDGLPKILVDTATREGMSGAPVVAIADGELELMANLMWKAMLQPIVHQDVYTGL
jgi:hypothetical protein